MGRKKGSKNKLNKNLVARLTENYIRIPYSILLNLACFVFVITYGFAFLNVVKAINFSPSNLLQFAFVFLPGSTAVTAAAIGIFWNWSNK